MPDEKELFHTVGKTWAERAGLGELGAVLNPSGNLVRNTFLHNNQIFAAKRALGLLAQPGRVLDFGCGTGRFLRFFAGNNHSVLGTDITKEMLEQAKHFGLPESCQLALTDGIEIPSPDRSIDLVWICSVLRYSLNVSNPVYDRIAREMYRVVKPGGRVVNLEMYVEQPVADFTRDFEAAGFQTESVRVINRHSGRFERFAQSGRLPISLVALSGRLTAFCRFYFDSAEAQRLGIRDYLFVWQKPGE